MALKLTVAIIEESNFHEALLIQSSIQHLLARTGDFLNGPIGGRHFMILNEGRELQTFYDKSRELSVDAWSPIH
jgi:hypothetical protein